MKGSSRIDSISFHSLVPPVAALEITTLELLAAGLLGRQTLLGDSLSVLRVGFGDAPASSTVAAFPAVESDVPAFWDEGRLQPDEIAAFLFARPFSWSLGFGEQGLPLALGWRCGFFALDEPSMGRDPPALIGFGACIEAMSPDLASEGLGDVMGVLGGIFSVSRSLALHCFVSMVGFPKSRFWVWACLRASAT